MKEETLKSSVIEGLKKIRKARKLTQGELAKILGISQQRLSEIERGKGSISAEQLLKLLARFNLPLSYFLKEEKKDPEAKLQNALARLGANHLREIPEIIVPEKYNDPNEVVFETLYTSSSPRLIIALAPIIVKNIQRINFALIEKKLHDFGRENRLWWILENTLQSIQSRLKEPLPRNLKLLYRIAETALAGNILFRQYVVQERLSKQQNKPEDILDSGIASQKTLEVVKSHRDEIAQKWNITTRIKQSDFEEALKNAEVS